MMKQLLAIGMLLILADYRSFAQGTSNLSQAPGATQLSPPTTPTVVTDTLNYFFNKQFFKIANPTGLGFPYYKSAAVTGTNFTHMGASFINTDPGLVISGLESRLASEANGALSIPIRMYLYNVDANMIPTTVIDSVSKSIGSAQMAGTWAPTGYAVSGSFTNASGPVSHAVPGNFAIVVRNLSTLTGDSLRIYRTSSMVSPTSTLQPRGEGLGIVRQAGVFKKTTNLNNINFGAGTDYEFCVAPICTFTLIADHIAPPKVNSQPVDTISCWEPLTFTNTSSPEWTNRFFNLNEFYRHHWPFANSPATGWSADSAISWYFDDEDGSNPYLRPNIILKNNTTTGTKYYDTAGCFTSCSMRARYHKMTAMGSNEAIWGNISFSLCVSCWWSGVGVNEIPTLNGLVIFPNPAVDGKVKISGLKGGEHTIQVFDMLGSLKVTIRTREEDVMIDLLKEPAGAYLIRVSDKNQRYRNMKVVNQRE